MKKNFYSLLFKVFLPFWLVWQLGWHLAFNHIVDFQQGGAFLLTAIKLWLESLYLLLVAFCLYKKRERLDTIKFLIIISILCLSAYTALSTLRAY